MKITRSHPSIVRSALMPVMLVAALVGCDAQQDYSCEALGERTPICGFQAPEDIEVTPAGNKLILSQFGGITGGSAGSLVLFDPDTDNDTSTNASAAQVKSLYPATISSSDGDLSWGSESCPGEPGDAFSPHGIHLSQRADGAWQLLAVNHGGRESVEFFEWQAEQESLTWRGCVVMPEGGFINDTVATPDGGLLATQMFPKDNYWALLRTLMGAKRGHVWRWRPGNEVDVQPGSTGSFPNGIQISEDGSNLFVNLYTENTVRKIDRLSGEHLGDVHVEHPDNSSWLPDGRLVVASHPPEELIPDLCMDVHSGACGSHFLLVAIDSSTLEKTEVFDHRGAPMGGGTVAVELGDYWYIGSFAGNRLLRVPSR